MAAAPLSLVAVPTTVAPACANVSAIAAPMPRDAPVTNAILPLKSCELILFPVGWRKRTYITRPSEKPLSDGLPLF